MASFTMWGPWCWMSTRFLCPYGFSSFTCLAQAFLFTTGNIPEGWRQKPQSSRTLTVSLPIFSIQSRLNSKQTRVQVDRLHLPRGRFTGSCCHVLPCTMLFIKSSSFQIGHGLNFMKSYVVILDWPWRDLMAQYIFSAFYYFQLIDSMCLYNQDQSYWSTLWHFTEDKCLIIIQIGYQDRHLGSPIETDD